jgi:archaellum component FlaC
MTASVDTTPDTATEYDREELVATIAELETYRQRLMDDTLEVAQKAKIMKSKALEQIQPELDQLDSTLTFLRSKL